jgi:hypothetical protein
VSGGGGQSIVRVVKRLLKGPIHLASGGEWHSKPFPLTAGDDLKVVAKGSVRFYAWLYDEQTYQSERERSPKVFPFKFGTDQTYFEHTFSIRFDGNYRLVFRVGGWTKAGTIQVEVDRILPPEGPL